MKMQKKIVLFLRAFLCLLVAFSAVQAENSLS